MRSDVAPDTGLLVPRSRPEGVTVSDATNRTDVDEPTDVIKSQYLHMLATSTRSLFAPSRESHEAAMRAYNQPMSRAELQAREAMQDDFFRRRIGPSRQSDWRSAFRAGGCE